MLRRKPERGDGPWARAVVTGASSGIGAALARELGRRGTEVLLVARRRTLLEQVRDEIVTHGGRAECHVLDVSDTDAIVSRLAALDVVAPIDLVIANAGVGANRDVDPDAWGAVAQAFHVNFCGAAATLMALAPAMAARGRGHLAGIGSLASFGALPQSAAYCAPKAGLTMLLDCLRLDLAASGVAVTSVHLGFVRTAMVSGSTHPMPQLLEPEDAARHVVDGLARRPSRIVHPQALGAVARGLAAMPERWRQATARMFPRSARGGPE